MKKILALLLLVIALGISPNAHANATSLGAVIQANYSAYDINHKTPHGAGGGGGIVYSLFPDFLFGLRASATYDGLSTGKGTGYKVSGFAPLFTATANLNLNPSSGPMSYGIGWGWEAIGNLKCEGDASCPSYSGLLNGFVIDAKGQFGKGSRWFGYGIALFPMDKHRRTINAQFFLGVGLELGSTSKN